ncbi:endonuclease [Neisseria sp. N95_16]|uniref:Endonuclease n=1 Tax=Neisseria brasiliensis TaxID=2666100 RepID=A0A7X2KYA9_9NEIS|nr:MULTISPECIES: endonuclease/exonuclease/phosphatase family protein [Neisseria]MRN37938.1 endonuclease [Neisseria brasiliensis]PJO08497.1 endonuclease [Neisseria sp. N95_16]
MSDLPLGDWLLLALLCVPVVATLLSLLKSDHWVMRIFDFPRLQIAALSVLCMLLNYWLEQSSNAIFDFMEVVNFACAVWQFWQISAYTRLRKKQVKGYQSEDNNRTVSILASNVLTTNRQADKLLSLIRQYRPDVVLTLESDQWWENALAELETDHPYTVKVPLDNLYGMHLYSRLPLHDAEVKYRVRDDIPSITAKVELPSGELIRIYCLHPMPPSPTESETSTERDGELLLVGKEITASDESCMVFGDLNDVAWSDTSRLFQRISGLLDPRIGRGLYNTFHADWKLLRWPLDHIFHSNDFLVADLKVLPHIGSDHFPIYGKFQYHPPAEHVHETPESDHGDKQEAAEKIDAAMELQNE